MKQTKKLTYVQRMIVESWGLKSKNWRREKIVSGYIHLRNIVTNELRLCPNRIKEKRL